MDYDEFEWVLDCGVLGCVMVLMCNGMVEVVVLLVVFDCIFFGVVGCDFFCDISVSLCFIFMCLFVLDWSVW